MKEKEEKHEGDLAAASPSFAFFKMAEIHCFQGRYQEAIKTCLAGLKERPGSLPGRLLLGRCYLLSGEKTKARAEMEKISREIEECLPVYQLLSQIYREEGDTEKALDAQRKVSHFSANEPPQDGRPPVEKDVLHQGSNPPFVAPLSDLGDASKSMEKEGAVRTPISTDTLAEIYIQQGHLPKALSIYEEILKWDPENSAARAKYESLQKKVRGDRAVRTRKRALHYLERWLASVSKTAGASS